RTPTTTRTASAPGRSTRSPRVVAVVVSPRSTRASRSSSTPCCTAGPALSATAMRWVVCTGNGQLLVGVGITEPSIVRYQIQYVAIACVLWFDPTHGTFIGQRGDDAVSASAHPRS